MPLKYAEIGKKVPDFTLPASDGRMIKLSDYRGKRVIIYFYPKDMTPACTTQSCDFRDYHDEFKQHNTQILGINMDEGNLHMRFTEKYQLPFILLTDANHKVCELFAVWQLKKLYGREYMGIERSTFLIDETGKLVKEWRRLKTKGHVEAVLEAVKAFPQ